jgi:hypothetical protein
VIKTQIQSAPAQDIAADVQARISGENLALQEKFAAEGYIGPFKLSDDVKLDTLLLERYLPGRFLTWYKSFHEKSVPVIRTASVSEITDKLQLLLGNDILIWGSVFIGQKPEQAHNWHLDVEYGSGCNGATLWLGLKNLNSKTTVSLITRSHLLQTAPQELEDKFSIDTLDDNLILNEAKKLDARCELKIFTLNPGEFIIWSGRVWHSTLNNSDKTRFSIILQYCTPDNVPRIPLSYSYPDTKWSDARPPCVMVKGADAFHRNKLVHTKDIEFLYAYLRPVYFSFYKARQLLAYAKQKAVLWLGLHSPRQ